MPRCWYQCSRSAAILTAEWLRTQIIQAWLYDSYRPSYNAWTALDRRRGGRHNWNVQSHWQCQTIFEHNIKQRRCWPTAHLNAADSKWEHEESSHLSARHVEGDFEEWKLSIRWNLWARARWMREFKQYYLRSFQRRAWWYHDKFVED